MKTRRTLDVSPESKPIDPLIYADWVKTNLGVEITNRNERHYELVKNTIKNRFEESSFWIEFTNQLRSFHAEYEIERGYPLLQSPEQPLELITKPWTSFFEKTIRHNVIMNDKFPKSPKGGWILPDNWFSRIDDIVRTTIVVKYLDGVHFLVNKTRMLCVSPYKLRCDFEAKETGYYAVHMYIVQRLEVPKIDLGTEILPLSIEIQIRTQIQDVIRKLSHEYYEEKRSRTPILSQYGWQWDYESEEFIPYYLGHILDYVEGMIMEIRNRG